MKKLILPLLFCFLLCGCTGLLPQDDGRVKIVATLFPQYDFAREICGDKADIFLLLPPGMDSHSYEPTPSNMVKISEADLFLYTGSAMEPWADKLSESVKGERVDVSHGLSLLSGDDIHHSETHTHAKETTDPHVWTNPQNAVSMVDTICAAVCKKDPVNADFYRQNTENYKAKLLQLDREFETCVQNGKRKHIVFGGHFAMRYFVHRYGLSYASAFDACSGETEPSPSTLISLVESMRTECIPAVFYEELSTPRTAALIAEETGAQMLLLHSCHNISKDESGETYLSLMYKNLENLKIGLN